MALDLLILTISIVIFMMILTFFTAGTDNVTNMQSAGSIFFIILAFVIYYYNLDPFPLNVPFLGSLHILTIGFVNAMSMLDFLFTSIFGIPLSLDLFLIVIIPTLIIYHFVKMILSYTVVLSENTSRFIAMVAAFLSLVATSQGQFNFVTYIFARVLGFAQLFASGGLFQGTVALFVISVFVIALSVFLEVMAVEVTMKLVEDED